MIRLQAQLQEKETDHSESIKSLEAKHSTEVQTLKELLATSESTNTELQTEVILCSTCSYCSCSCVYMYSLFINIHVQGVGGFWDFVLEHVILCFNIYNFNYYLFNVHIQCYLDLLHILHSIFIF